MIILDTNVISEFARPRPDDNVRTWLDGQRGDDTFITAVTVAEVLHGVGRLPAGTRRAQLESAVPALLALFHGRVLAFDERAAVAYAAIVVDREARGHAISMADAQIAAMVRIHDASLATRNTKDFAGLGLDLIDPWTVSGD